MRLASSSEGRSGASGTRRRYQRQSDAIDAISNGRITVDTLDDFIARRGFDREEIHREALRLIAECRAYELQEARRAEHLTQTDVAERMGISQARVSEVESGDIGSLKVSTLMRYAEALGGTFEALIQIGDKTIRLA
ncbi:helix-turn-helix domain-containing protein [Olsenella sp. SW781]|nr:helix-turn-helix domain-containing protein [Olsenella sp. SW781]